MPDCCRKTLIYIHTVHLLLQIDESDTNSMVLKNDFSCHSKLFVKKFICMYCPRHQNSPFFKEHVEGQVCVTTDMFRSPLSRRRPSSCAISSVCLPWNAATDSNSSLGQQGIIWKGWQNQHTVCRLSPCYSGSFGLAVCSEHQRAVGLKGGEARFNQTFGGASVFSVMCHHFKEIKY